MKSNERWFWVAFVLSMLFTKVVAGLGLPHRLLPGYFDAPAAVCERGGALVAPELADPKPNPPPAPVPPAQAAINSVVGEVAHG